MSRKKTQKRGTRGFISGPLTDTFFLIASPIVGLVLYLILSSDPLMFHEMAEGHPFTSKQIMGTLSLIIIYAHIFIVFFRSHVNPAIFRKFPYRFTLLPVLLFVSIYFSKTALAVIAILAVWWDVYHSSLQTFGIGRIYDKLQGNDLNLGRRLDITLNLLLYAGPIVGGVVFLDHLRLHQNSSGVLNLADLLLGLPPANQMGKYLLALGIPFCIYYVYAYWRLAQKGYRVSYQKVALLVVLALTSLFCWGSNSFGGAFFIMNFFHALQYFFLVWFVEKKNITSLFGMANSPHGQTKALGLFVFIGVACGVWSQTQGALHFSAHSMVCLLLVISIMHFWYDGFIWSVRGGQL